MSFIFNLVRTIKDNTVNLIKETTRQVLSAPRRIYNFINPPTEPEIIAEDVDDFIPDLPEIDEQDVAQILEEDRVDMINFVSDSKRRNIEFDFNGDINLTLERVSEMVDTIRNTNVRLLVNIEFKDGGKVGYTLNRDTIEKFMKLIDVDFFNLSLAEEPTESDAELSEMRVKPVKTIEFSKLAPTSNLVDGAFFKYLHNIEDPLINWERYGLFNKFDVENYSINCVIRAFINSGLFTEVEIKTLKSLIKTRHIPRRKLKIIAEKMKIKITTRRLDIKGNTRVEHYGKEYESNKEIKLGLLDNHYFINDKETNVTSYAINHYHEIKHIKDWNKIYNRRNDKINDSSRFIDSFSLIKLLIDSNNKEKLLTPISSRQLLKTTNFDLNKLDLTDLTVDDSDFRLMLTKEEKKYLFGKKTKSRPKEVYFDFETYTDEDIHKPYLMCALIGKEQFSSIGSDCGLNFLEALSNRKEKSFMCLAHNLTYDIKFLIKYLTIIKAIFKGKKVLQLQALYKGKKLTFKDSALLIPTKLSNFGNMFNLDTEKEVMPYGLYSANKPIVTIKEALEYFTNEEDKKQFLQNAKKWNCINEKTFNHIEYSRRYCMIDCIVLKKGFTTFRRWIRKVCKLDPIEYVTLPSLVDSYFIEEGCYKDVYELSSVSRAFIQKCVVGGRTMTKLNKKYHITKKLQDFDGVSLYPSAMKELAEQGGFLKGDPKVLVNSQLNYEFLQKQDGYFVEIKVNKVGIHRDFPLLSFKNDKGVREFNDVDIKNKSYFVDKTSLEDLIEFQKIEFEIIRGYYFNEGRNNRVGKVIQHLFDERLRMKKIKNPIQVVYKLLMNSAYGKTIMKAIENEQIVINDETHFNKQVSRYFNYISEINYIDSETKKSIFKMKKSLIDFYSRPHVGVEILSMSKRIMNRVMTLAQDIGIKIYYQDTDSMHIEAHRVNDLADAFRKKYNKELIGKQLGQFHCDFDSHKNTDNKKEIDVPVSIESIFLGKKMYIDKIKHTIYSKKDNSFIREEISYHIRMKGVSTGCINYEVENNKLFNNPMDLYKHLHDGNEIEFDLCKDVNRVFFENNKNFTVSTRDTFIRKIRIE